MRISVEILGITAELSITAGIPDDDDPSLPSIPAAVLERSDDNYETDAHIGFR